MGLPKSFDFLKTVEIVLRESVGDAEASYVVASPDGFYWGSLICEPDAHGGPWVWEADGDWFQSQMLADIAEALEALNALENGGRNE